jgi:hypothetical protein
LEKLYQHLCGQNVGSNVFFKKYSSTFSRKCWSTVFKSSNFFLFVLHPHLWRAQQATDGALAAPTTRGRGSRGGSRAHSLAMVRGRQPHTERPQRTVALARAGRVCADRDLRAAGGARGGVRDNSGVSTRGQDGSTVRVVDAGAGSGCEEAGRG